LREKDKLDEARKTAEEALALRKEMSDESNMALSGLQLAQIALDQKKLPEAESLARKSAATFEKIKSAVSAGVTTLCWRRFCCSPEHQGRHICGSTRGVAGPARKRPPAAIADHHGLRRAPRQPTARPLKQLRPAERAGGSYQVRISLLPVRNPLGARRS